MKFLSILISLLLLQTSFAQTSIYKNKNAPIESRVADLVKRMNLDKNSVTQSIPSNILTTKF